MQWQGGPGHEVRRAMCPVYPHCDVTIDVTCPVKVHCIQLADIVGFFTSPGGAVCMLRFKRKYANALADVS